LLAMNVNDNAFILNVRGVLESIASKLAPTGAQTAHLSVKLTGIGTVQPP